MPYPRSLELLRAGDVRPASVDELSAIVEAMPEQYRALVLLGAWCALRSGELLELRRRDVDVVHGTVRVERAVSWVRGKAVTGTPKSAAGTRTVAIPPHIVPVVTHHLEVFTGSAADALLFPGANGVSNLQPSTLYKYWQPARVSAGRPDLRLHDLRHTGATMAAMAGATLADLQQRLGHSSVNAALRYQHASQDRDLQIAEALSLVVQLGRTVGASIRPRPLRARHQPVSSSGRATACVRSGRSCSAPLCAAGSASGRSVGV